MPCRSGAELHEIAMTKGSSEWAPQHALFYFIATNKFAADWGEDIVCMNWAMLPAKTKKYKLQRYMRISLFHENWR